MRYYADRDYIHARLYAMRSAMLTLKGYASILRDREAFFGTASEDKDYIGIKEKAFASQITGIMSIAEASVIYAPVFIAFIRLYELKNIRLVLAKASGRQVVDQWYDIGPYAVIERDLLQGKKTIDDIRMILVGTYLEGVVEEGLSYERLEICLDILSVRMLQDSLAGLPAVALRDLNDILSMRTAVIFLIWKQRLRQGYGWSDERISAYIKMPPGISPESLRIHEGVVGKAVDAQLKTGPHSSLSLADMEYHLEQFFYAWISKRFHRDFHSICCVISFLWLVRYQISNLFVIIEGSRFGLTNEEILERIICGV